MAERHITATMTVHLDLDLPGDWSHDIAHEYIADAIRETFEPSEHGTRRAVVRIEPYGSVSSLS